MHGERRGPSDGDYGYHQAVWRRSSELPRRRWRRHCASGCGESLLLIAINTFVIPTDIIPRFTRWLNIGNKLFFRIYLACIFSKTVSVTRQFDDKNPKPWFFEKIKLILFHMQYIH